jgi:ligand-binding sensor domain-containing protein
VFEYDDWGNNDYWDLGNARDILEVAVKDGEAYYASWYNGIPCRDVEENYIDRYGHLNTNGALDTVYYSNNRIRISDLKFDNDGNLWGLSSEVNHPLFVKTKNGEWYSFTMHQSQVALFFDDLLIDSYNQKWGIIGRGSGVFVYNHNNTIETSLDDQYKLLNTNAGNGNLPSLQTYSIAEDLDGEIWVGTDRGIGVFYDPSSVFSGGNFDSQQILIQEGDYGQYLLSEEKIKCIAIDGANRKWIGTEKSGVFLLAEDGLEQILHFTSIFCQQEYS